jgi:hypothetical protein
MENLMKAMRVIDQNSSLIPEGDYLEICNYLKAAYNQRSDPESFFDYENFRILPPSQDDGIVSYFYNHYLDVALEFDIDFIYSQIHYLENELVNYKSIRRISKPLKKRVLKHYCRIYNVDPGEGEQYFEPKLLTKLCRSYIEIENDFRSRYREVIEKKILWLEEAKERFEEI